nr:aminopeptidase N-like [Megalopta genalis]
MSPLLLLSLLLLSSASLPGTGARYRLENNVMPIKYLLELEPDLQSFKFTGNVTIFFEVKSLTSLLILNQKNLTIHSVEIENNVAKIILPNDKLETLTIYCKEDLKPYVLYMIKIRFEGVLNNQEVGFYRSTYHVGREIRWIAATHFQPTGARLAFPCWDEPEFKAIFDIAIRHLPQYTAVISNMPVLYTIDDGGMKVTAFKSTKPMSTYLVAFVVSDYAYKAHDKDDTFKIYTKAETVNRTTYALDFSVKAMEQLDILTGIKYSESMPKMDQVAIRDFIPYGMENWGLVAYRENTLLYKEGVDTNHKKQKMALIIAHEFTHQWFGNLVSPKWWEYLWLNEGFATFYEYYITNKIETTWRLMEAFVVDVLQPGLLVDAFDIEQPLNHPVDSPNEILEVFQHIAYRKGGSIVRMMINILTEEVFLKGVRTYLKENKYKSIDSDELIKYLQAAAGYHAVWGDAKLEEIMDTWITRSGYPVVTVKEDNGNFVLSQERFLYYGFDEVTKWWIPITYVTKENLNFSHTAPIIWLKPTEDSHTISNVNSDWILLNNLQMGFYRVNYEKHIWEKITQYLLTNFEEIHAVTRAQLIDDALNVARNNLTSYYTALDLTLYLHNETDYIPWMTTFRNLDFLNSMLFPSKHYDIFKDYVRYIMQGLTNNVTYKILPHDSHTMKILKTNAFLWACKLEFKECRESIREEFDKWVIDDKHVLDTNLKSSILCTGMKTANETFFEAIVKRLTTSTFDADETNIVFATAGCSRNSTILQHLLVESLSSPGYIDLEDAEETIDSDNHSPEAENVSSIDQVMNKFENAYKNITKLVTAEKIVEPCMYDIYNAALNFDDILELHRFIIHAKPKLEAMVNYMQTATRHMDWDYNYRTVIEKWLIEHKDQFGSTSGTGKITFALFLLIPSIFITRFY